MNLPERELNHPEWYARELGACSQCSEPMLQVEDEGHHIIACRVCDLGGVADNDRTFKVKFYGIDDGEDLHSFQNGIIADSRTEMLELIEWWGENFHWEIKQQQHDGKENIFGILVEGNVLESNPSRQYFIYHQSQEIGCIVEVA